MNQNEIKEAIDLLKSYTESVDAHDSNLFAKAGMLIIINAQSADIM